MSPLPGWMAREFAAVKAEGRRLTSMWCSNSINRHEKCERADSGCECDCHKTKELR